MANLTEDQKRAFSYIIDFIKSKMGDVKAYLTFGGYAGVGKTFLVGQIAEQLKKEGLKLAFCALSGKAVGVLKSKVGHIIDPEVDFCGTIHKLIYQYRGKDRQTNAPIFTHAGTDQAFDVVFVDESSMINSKIFDDIMLIEGAVKIFIGDHGQLPPVGDKFNLMESPQIRLEKIVRQAEDNQIIHMSMLARTEGYIPAGIFGKDQEVIKTNQGAIMNKYDLASEDLIILTSSNRERIRYNSYVRERYGYNQSHPMPKEKLICIMNNYKYNIFNGQLCNVVECDGKLNKVDAVLRYYDNQQRCYVERPDQVECYEISYTMTGEDLVYTVYAPKDQFLNADIMEASRDYVLFDFGFCLTVHKSQGSEWNTVIFREGGREWLKNNWNRFLYTAVTRAKKKLIVIGN